MQNCYQCGVEFPRQVIIAGTSLNLAGRKRCLDCLPHRPLKGPRKRVQRKIQVWICASCGTSFPSRVIADGKLRTFYRRRFCLACSPLGTHNTSKFPLGLANGHELRRQRRRRKYRSTYRYQKKRRTRLKVELIAQRGGRCEACAYSAIAAALEFHHRDPRSKDFGLGSFSGSRERLEAEAAKCELLCANCHRLRHAALQEARMAERGQVVTEGRYAKKSRAVRYMGSTCWGCDRTGPLAIFEFHHRDPREKEFGISQSGSPRSWERIVAELAKCVMLCANCHREVHTGVRDVVEGLLGLAEDAVPYGAASA